MLVKVRFIKNEKPTGREYTYRAGENIREGDAVAINSAKAVVTKINVDEAEVEAFKDKVKSIDGKIEEVENNE